MSDQQAPADAASSAASDQTPPQQPPAPAATPAEAPPAVPAPADAPEWLPDRLKQAKATAQRDLLAAVGAKDPDELAAKLKRLEELEAASLSESERQQKQIQELTTQAALAQQLQAQRDQMVDSQLAAYPEQVRASIEATAGEDRGERWRLMQAFAAAGVLNQQVPAVPTAPPPANTTPHGTPPAPAPPTTAHTEWERIKNEPGVAPDVGASSIAGQLHYMAKHREIERGQ